MVEIKGLYTSAKIFTDDVKRNAVEQINNYCNDKQNEGLRVRVMPDVHAGKTNVIGFTSTLGKSFNPSLIGNDIGCGMYVVNLGKEEIDLNFISRLCRALIPSGRRVWDKNPYPISTKLEKLKCFNGLRDLDYLHRSMGTLGGGNHFIEIDKDDENNKYLVIHTGSRNLGAQVYTYYQNKAKNVIKELRNQIIKEYKARGKEKEIQKALESLKLIKDTEFLEGQDLEDYLEDMKIVCQFAKENRETIAEMFIKGGKFTIVEAFHTIHNYIDTEKGFIRKGAISAQKDEKVFIPANPKEGGIIGIGLGNEDWNYSAPHGAGRVMSRNEARHSLGLCDYYQDMVGIYAPSINLATIDESPRVYRNLDYVVNSIKDTVRVEKIIYPIFNFKAID